MQKCQDDTDEDVADDHPRGHLLHLLRNQYIIIRHLPVGKCILQAALLDLLPAGIMLDLIHQHEGLRIVAVDFQHKVEAAPAFTQSSLFIYKRASRMCALM